MTLFCQVLTVSTEAGLREPSGWSTGGLVSLRDDQGMSHERLLAEQLRSRRTLRVFRNSHMEPSVPNHQEGSRWLRLNPGCLDERKPAFRRIGPHFETASCREFSRLCVKRTEHAVAFHPCVEGIL